VTGQGGHGRSERRLKEKLEMERANGEEGERYEGQKDDKQREKDHEGDEARCTLTSTEVHPSTVSSGFRVPFIQS